MRTLIKIIFLLLNSCLFMLLALNSQLTSKFILVWIFTYIINVTFITVS